MPDKLTDEETELAKSALESHNLIEMVNTNGWKNIKKKYFDIRLKEYREQLLDVKNDDIALIQGIRFVIEFIVTLLSEIELQVKIGLEDEIELEKRKEKKKKGG